jgi:hypothetical protein
MPVCSDLIPFMEVFNVMNSLPITEPVPPLPRVALEPQRDAASAAVITYLSGGNVAERADAFDHLLAICHRAVKPFYLRDPHGGMTVIETPQFNAVQGGRTGFHARREGTKSAATRAWIEEWLLEFLAPYYGKTEVEIAAAADHDEFRYVGRLCRFALVKAVRMAMAAKRKLPIHVSLDAPVGEDGGALFDYIGTDRRDAPSSLATGTGFEEFVRCVSNIARAVAANVEELARLDVLDGLFASLENAESLEHVSARSYARQVTEAIARVRGVSLVSARAYKRRFHATMARELAAGNPAVKAVFLELPDQRAMGGRRVVPRHEESAEDMPPAATETFYRKHGCGWDEVQAA